MQKKPTIIDVAREAGVSKSLVSLALRGGPGVKEHTRAHIVETATRLGYRTNTWARSLVQGRTGLIGVVLTDLANPYSIAVANAIEDRAQEHDVDVLMGHGRRDPRVLEARISRFADLGAEGIIVVSGHVDRDFLTEMSARLPLVVVGRYEHIDVDTVSNHDELGARLAIDHLESLGHRRLAYVPMSVRPSTAARTRTVQRECAERGIELVDFEPTTPLDQELISRIVARQCTAAFVSNDKGALELMGLAHDHGLVIPRDLAVVGYDDSSLASVARPALTSVRQPLGEMGMRAFDMLAERRDGRTTPRHDVRDPTLVVRESSRGAVRES